MRQITSIILFIAFATIGAQAQSQKMEVVAVDGKAAVVETVVNAVSSAAIDAELVKIDQQISELAQRRMMLVGLLEKVKAVEKSLEAAAPPTDEKTPKQ